MAWGDSCATRRRLREQFDRKAQSRLLYTRVDMLASGETHKVLAARGDGLPELTVCCRYGVTLV